MSQEAEYLLRNISSGQVRDIARRITGHQLAASEGRMRQWWQGQLGRLESRMHGEVVGLRAEMLRRQNSLVKDLECNRRLTEALRQQVNLQGEDLECQRAAIESLEEHSRLLHTQIEETNRHQAQLTEHLATLDAKVKADIAERQAVRLRNASHALALQRLVIDSIGRIDGRQAQQVGLSADLDVLYSIARRADAIAANAEQSQAAIALYSDALNHVDRLQVECSRRETELAQQREVARLSLAIASEQLLSFATDPEAASVFAKVIPALREEIDRISGEHARMGHIEGVDFSRRLAEACHVAEAARDVADRVEQLWRERDEVLNKIRQRNRILEEILKSLIEVWGSRFDLEEMYTTTDDPRSTLMLQSRRPHGKNVTIHLDLDGRMQISFTGYLGMQCAKDVQEFQRHLEQAGELHVNHVATKDQPDQPNPPRIDDGDSSRPALFKPLNVEPHKDARER